MIRTTCCPKIHDTVVACWALSKWNLEDNLPCFKNKTVLDRYDNSTCELQFVVICTFENKIIIQVNVVVFWSFSICSL